MLRTMTHLPNLQQSDRRRAGGRRLRRMVVASLVALAVPAAALSSAHAAHAAVGPIPLPIPTAPVAVTYVYGTPNPAAWNDTITMVVHECAYGWGHNPTGIMGFRNLNTGLNL